MNADPRPLPASAARLIADLEDGVISPDDRARLMDLLRSEESVRDLYLDHIRLAALIHQAAESRMELGTMPVSPETLRREKRRSAFLSLSYAAAVLLVLGLGLLLYQVSRGTPPARTITLDGSADAAYAVVRDAAAASTRTRLLPGDQITLSRGLLRLGFPSGVEALVEGPSQLELLTHSTLRMDGGSGWFHVPAKARGFTVRTERGRVIDLGTEFGIRFDPRGDLEVHVATGRVKVIPSVPGARETELRTAEAMRFDAVGRHHPLDLRTGTFRRQFSRQVPHLHWSFDTPVDGAFPATGTLPDLETLALHPQRPGPIPADPSGCLTAGVFGKALSLHGDGLFAESAFPGFPDDAPLTVAAWVRYRGGFPESDADPRTGLGATTRFGRQAYLLEYTNSRLTTAQGATGRILTAGTTYTLDFHVGALPGNGTTGYQVELVAFEPAENDDARRIGQSGEVAGTAIARSGGRVDTCDLSHHSRIGFTATADNPHLGKDLAIRLLKIDGPVLYDHLRLTTRRGAGPETLVFSESFESPPVAGYAEQVLPARNWVGATHSASNAFGAARHGLFSQRPVFSAPIVAWGEPSSAWVAFVVPGKNLGWSVADSRHFHDAPSGLPRDQWFHLATVRSGRRDDAGQPEILHFLDGLRLPGGAPRAHAKARLPAAGPGARLLIGALPGTTPGDPTLDADIDELHLLRAALGEKEIWRLMDENRPVFAKEP